MFFCFFLTEHKYNPFTQKYAAVPPLPLAPLPLAILSLTLTDSSSNSPEGYWRYGEDAAMPGKCSFPPEWLEEVSEILSIIPSVKFKMNNFVNLKKEEIK